MCNNEKNHRIAYQRPEGLDSRRDPRALVGCGSCPTGNSLPQHRNIVARLAWSAAPRSVFLSKTPSLPPPPAAVGRFPSRPSGLQTKRKREPRGTLFFFWKGNHILIEFPSMVSNARVRLQIDAHGFKLRCTVSGHFLPETAVYH